MPNKKGSKVAASKARAQAKAKKKARQGGPVLAAAAYVPPPVGEEADEDVHEPALEPAAAPAATAERPAPAAARAPRGFRRELAHQAPPALSVSLRREVGLIGALTAVVGAALLGLRFLTDLGA